MTRISSVEAQQLPLEKTSSAQRDYLRSILRFDKLTVPRKIEGQSQPKADPPQVEADMKTSYGSREASVQLCPQANSKLTSSYLIG